MKNYIDCPPGSALSLVLRISQIAGIAPITFSSLGLHKSRSLAFYGHLLVTAINCVVLNGFVLDLMAEPEESLRVSTSTAQVIWIANLTIVMLISSVSVYRAPPRIDCIIKCLKQIREIKVLMREEIILHSEEKLKKLIVIAVCAGLWTLIAFDLGGYVRYAIIHDRKVLALLMYSFLFYEYFLVLLVELQFVFVAFHILSALQLINWRLQQVMSSVLPIGENRPTAYTSLGFKKNPYMKMNKLTLDSEVKIPNECINTVVDKLAFKSKAKHVMDGEYKCNGVEYNIIEYAIAYGHICDVIRQINEAHGLLLMLMLASFFIQLVITPYYMIGALYITTGQIPNLLLQACWCMFHIVCMFLVVEPCYRILREMDKMQLLVCHFICQMTPVHPIVYNLNRFSQQLITDRPTFSPLGMVTLSRPIIIKIIGAVTTYLVIIVQFRAME